MTIGIIIVLAMIGVLVFASTKPDTVSIQRTADIKAPPDRIFGLINDFHQWPSWAPQDTMDPSMQRTFGGTMKGTGATSDWVSKGNAGSGHMQITVSNPPSTITVTVDFVKPFLAHNINTFSLVPLGGSTRVTWTMQGSNPYVAKVMGIFVDMDQVMGKHFEEGLRSLKIHAER